MVAEHRAKSQRPLELYGKAYAYHPSRLAVDLEDFKPKPVKITSITEQQKEIFRMQKIAAEIEADNDRIIKIEDEEIPNIRARYDTDMGHVANNDEVQK